MARSQESPPTTPSLDSSSSSSSSKDVQSELVISIGDGPKLLHQHTGLQYEINLAALTQTNVIRRRG